jgi:hypothetical protein
MADDGGVPLSAGFTSGPWFAKDAYRGQGFWIMREERGQGWVRDKRLDTPVGEFDEADARPIAAAPELEAELGELVDQNIEYSGECIVIRCGSHNAAIERVRNARAVLAKARGEQ